MKSSRLHLSSLLTSFLFGLVPAKAELTNLWSFDDTQFYPGGENGGQLLGTSVSNYATLPRVAGSYYCQSGGLFRTTKMMQDTSAWSFSIWFRSDTDIGSTDALASWMANGTTAHTLRNNSGSIAFDVGTTSYRWLMSESVANGQWHHLLLTTPTGKAPFTLYLDGVRRDGPSSNTATPGKDLETNVRLGASLSHNTASNQDWDGWLDDAAFFDEAITAEKVALINGLGKLGVGLEDYAVASDLLKAPAGTVAKFAGARWERVTSGLPGAPGSSQGIFPSGGSWSVVTSTGSGIRNAPVQAIHTDVISTPPTFTSSVGFGQSADAAGQISDRSDLRPLSWVVVGAPGEMPSLDAAMRQFDGVRDVFLSEVSSRTGSPPEINYSEIRSDSYSNTGNSHRFTDSRGSNEQSLPLVDGTTRRLAVTNQGVTSSINYATRVDRGFLAVSMDCENVSQLSVSGSINTDTPRITQSTGTLTVHGITWRAFYYRLSRLAGPAIHHIFLVPSDPAVTATVNTTSSESFVLKNLPAQCRIHHLWIEREFTTFSDATMQSLASRFLQATHAPAGWIRPAVRSGEVVPSGSTPLPLTFDATGLPPGPHSARFAVVPAGVNVTALDDEDFQTATLEVAAPQFTAAAPAAEISVLPGYAQKSGKIVLTPLHDFTFGAITATSNASWLKAVPSENRPGELNLTIDTTGLAEGSYETVVTISAGATVQLVTVRIRVWAPLYRQLIADPYRSRVYLLHDGSNHMVSSRILVLDAVKGTVIRELDVGRTYLMVQSQDGSRLFTMRRPANDIVPIDLHRIQAEAAIPLPAEVPNRNESFSNLQAGPGGVLYFINRLYAGKLFVFDTASGTVLQRIDAPTTATAFHDKLRTSADGRELFATLNVSDSYEGPFESLTRYQIASDGRLAAMPADDRSLLEPPSLSSEQLLQTTASGRKVSVADRVFQPGNFAATMRVYPKSVWSLAPDGEFVVCRDAIINGAGSVKLREMPMPLNLSAIATTAEGHVFHAGLSAFGFIDVIAEAGAEAAGFRAYPQHGVNCPAPESVRWIPVDGCREYRVHFSKNAAALATATPGAGTTTRTTRHHWLEPDIVMSRGETWHWRVDALTPSGLQRGAVQSFTVASFGNETPRIDLDVAKGCTSQPVPLHLNFTTQPTTVLTSSNKSWLKESGEPGLANSFRIDTTLIPSSYDEGVITVTADGETVSIPVAVRVHETDHVDLVASRREGRAHALVRSRSIQYPNAANPTGPLFLTKVDPATGRLLECRLAGFESGVLSLSPDESRISIQTQGNSGIPRTGGVEVLDAESLARIGYVWGGGRAALGPDQKLLTGGSLIDLQSGTLLARNNNSGPLSLFSPDGKTLYGGDHQGLYKNDATSPTLARTATLSRSLPSGQNPTASFDGSRIAYGTVVVNPDLQVIVETLQELRGISGDGNVAVTKDALIHLPSLRKIATTPTGPTEIAFCDAAGVLLHYTNQNANGVPAYQVLRYDTLLELKADTITPGIANGSSYSADTAQLTWSDLPAAASFRVYFGSDAAAVAAAGPGSPLELGVTLTPSWPTAVPLLAGGSYFWKVVAESPGGTSSSPVWSFRTPPFTLDVSAVNLLGPHTGPKVSQKVAISAPGASWQITTNTPWLSFAATSGNGSGEIVVMADPSVSGVRNGSFTVTVGNESTTVPVTLNAFYYHIRDYVADPDEPVMHLLVSRGPNMNDATENLYLIKMNCETQTSIETVDLGMAYTAFNSDLRLFLHRLDDRVYVYFSPAAKMVGCNRRSYKIETTMNTTAAFGSSVPGAMCPAGRGRIAVTSAAGPAIHDSATGAKLLSPPAGLSGLSGAVAPHSGDRVYCINATSNPPRPQMFRIFADRIEAGPLASAAAGFTNATMGISNDGETIYFRDAYYNRDLQLQGSGSRFAACNADGSLFLQTPTSGDSQWLNRGGGGVARAPLPLFLLPKIAWSPVNQRLLVRRSSSDSYDWVHPTVRDVLPLPAIPGGEWISTGSKPWSVSGTSPAVIRTGKLDAPGTGSFTSLASLLFKSPGAGTLTFDWRNQTNGSDVFELIVNGTTVDSRTANTSWLSRTRSIPAGASVEFRYWRYSGVAGTDPAGELRNVAFAPAASGVLASQPSKDSDGDGAEDELEAALGSDPANSDSRPVYGLKESAAAPAFLYERPVAGSWSYQVQISSDLVTWETIETSSTIETRGTIERVTTPLPAGRGRTFTRVLATPVSP